MVNKASLKAGLILFGIFLLGTLAGGAGMRAFMQRDYAEQLEAGPADRLGQRHFKAIARELDLRPEQREQVREIVQKHRSERQELMQQVAGECGAPLKEHKAKVDAEIRAVLDPEQQQRFDALIEKQGKRFLLGGRPGDGRGQGPGRQGRRARRGGPGGPRPGASAGPLRRFDDDDDGKLSQDEVPPRLWERFSGADTDGDGLLTADELREHRRRRRGN